MANNVSTSSEDGLAAKNKDGYHLVAGLFSSLALEKRGAPAMALLGAVLVGGVSGIFFLLA